MWIVAADTSLSAVYGALALIIVALIGGAFGVYTKRTSDPNKLMETFIDKVGEDNTRLRQEVKDLTTDVEVLEATIEKNKIDHKEELRLSERHCNERIDDLRTEFDQYKKERDVEVRSLQSLIYKLEHPQP